jgi:RNA polymerase sigma-70 factor (ECF subfamily)
MRLCPEWAEECNQEIWLTVYLKRHTFKGNSAFASWVYRVSRNIGLMRVRKLRKHKQDTPLEGLLDAVHTSKEIGEYFVDKSVLPDEQTHSKRLAQKAIRCMGRLTERERSSIVLRGVEGLKDKEVAKIHRVPVTAHKTVYYRAKQKLKRYMAMSEAV